MKNLSEGVGPKRLITPQLTLPYYSSGTLYGYTTGRTEDSGFAYEAELFDADLSYSQDENGQHHLNLF